MLRQRSFEGFFFCHSGTKNATPSPVTFALRLRCSLAWVLGRPLFSERDWARYCGDATATGHVNKAVGDFTARRRSARARLGKTSAAKRHAFQKRTVFTTDTLGYARRMRTVIPVPWDVAVSKQGRHQTHTPVSSTRVGDIGYRVLFFVELDVRFPLFFVWSFWVVKYFPSQKL